MGDPTLQNPNNREDVVLPTRDKTLDRVFIALFIIIAALLIISRF